MRAIHSVNPVVDAERVTIDVTYGVLVFDETLVISIQAHREHYACYVLEAMYPLLPFALLAANVNHDYVVFAGVAAEVFQVGECSLAGTSRGRIGMNDVHVGGHVRRLEEAVQICVIIQQAGTESMRTISIIVAADAEQRTCLAMQPRDRGHMQPGRSGLPTAA